MSKANRSLMTLMSVLALAGSALAADMKDMKEMKGMDMAQPAANQAQGMGIVKAVDPKAGTVTIAHEPIKALSWPAMTMMFKVAQPSLLDKVAVGKKVEFELEPKASNPKITSLKVME